jgi:RNA polymerase sigma-70 factor (ECF subfamily)
VSVDGDAFDRFVEKHEASLRAALTSALGADVGPDAAAVAFEHGWKHWERVSGMDKPVAYLFTVGRNAGRKMLRRRPLTIPMPASDRLPWVEPGLAAALERLPERQRSVVMLLHGYEWTMSEVAEALGLTKATVQTHHDRGMARLRRTLGALA